MFLAVNLACGACGLGTAQARDIDRSDPLRARLLNLVRQPGKKLIVRDLLTDGQTAFLCVVNVPQEQSDRSRLRADRLAYEEWLLLRSADGRWFKIEWETVQLDETAECPNSRRFDTLQVVIAELANRSSTGLHANAAKLSVHRMQDLFDEPLQDIYLELAHRGVVPADFSVEAPKTGSDIWDEVCPSRSNCPPIPDLLFRRLERFQTSDAVSSIVWKGCLTIAAVSSNVDAISNCMKIAASKPACAPGPMYFRDLETIESCKFEVYRTCASVAPDSTVRQKGCDRYYDPRAGRKRPSPALR